MAQHSSKSTAQQDLTAVSATAPPTHPIPQLQGPFEESILESMNDRNDRQEKVDSITRRKQLIEREKYERTCAGRWKQRPGEKFHPLWKLVAQISFGMHLLAHGLAKSNEEVMRILQTHVDEIDGFLEYTTEDFELGQKDIQDRIRLLRVPLENVKIFDTMLEDREFRLSIVDGNEKIEHIVARTSRAMNDALKDVQKGINATKGLEKYLAEMNMGWEEKSEETEAVYLAMMSNVEGWNITFLDLQMKGNSLGVALVQLGGIVSEMSKRAGIASRRIFRTPLQPVTKPPPQRKSSTKAQRKSSNNTIRTHQSDKPLPEAPDPVDEAVQATLPKRHPDHKAVRRTSRKTPENDQPDQVKRTSQVRNSKSVPELSQTKPLQHVSSLRARGRSPSIRRLLSKKQRPLRAHVTPKPSPPAKDTPKTLSRKSSFFSSNSTSPDEARNRPGRLQKRASSFPPGSSYFTPPAPPSVPDGVASEPDSEAATSISAAPAPFVPTRREQPARCIDSMKAPAARPLARNTSNRIPIVVVDDTATTTSVRPENDFSATGSNQNQHEDDTLTALPEAQAQPENDPKSLRRVFSLSRNPKPPNRTSSLRTSKPRLSLFPVKSTEHLNLNRSVTSPTNFTPHYPPRPSSTPPFTNQAVASTKLHQERPPLPSFPRPITPTDSETSTPKNIPELAASPPDSPDSISASLPPVPLPPRSVKRHQAKFAIADYTNTSTELLQLFAASPPASSPLYKRVEHPNPLRSHAPIHVPTNIPSPSAPILGDEPRSPPPPGPGGPQMITRDFVTHPRLPTRKSVSSEKKGLKRIFSRNQGSKRETRTSSAGDGKWFSGMGKDGAWVKQ